MHPQLESLATFILHFITAYSGLWISNSLFIIVTNCVSYKLSIQSLCLIPVLCMCIVLSSLFFSEGKCLIIEPKSPQSLKNIYRVLKFAAKHKAPLNRSALTYWEENIPSRLDLGKSRYGGPFTTEQVEDVKTFFRLLLVFLPVWLAVFSASIFGTFELKAFDVITNDSESTEHCLNSTYEVLTYSPWWCSSITLLVYKICVHSCIKNKFPSILKRLGFHLLLLTLLNTVYAFTGYIFRVSVWPSIAHTWLYGSLGSLVTFTAIEFMCAQSPYSMRGLLSGLNFFAIFLFVALGVSVFRSCSKLCTTEHCLLIPYSIGGGLSIVGFLLYLVVAGRYKMRVRDEEYFPYVHIEAIYDRYLSQANAETCSREHKKKCCVCF